MSGNSAAAPRNAARSPSRYRRARLARRWAEWRHGEVPSADRMAERLVRLYAGLVGFGISLALMVRARLGLASWDVLHQGIARQLGVQIGWVVIGMSAVVLLAWIPLRQRPGLGTVSNLVLVGLVANVALAVLPAPAGLGPGPRDGIMTGLAARGHSVRVVRTAIEICVIAVGYPLGGSVGPGTLAYALLIGPLVHLLLPRLAVPPARMEGRSS